MICYLYMVPIADRFVPTLNLSLWCLLCNHPPPKKDKGRFSFSLTVVHTFSYETRHFPEKKEYTNAFSRARFRLMVLKTVMLSRNHLVQRRTVKEETAVRGELPILSRWDREAVGTGQEGGVRFTHHIECEKEGERKHSQVSVLGVMQGRSERAQMGNQNDWIIESLKNRTSVITNLDWAFFFWHSFTLA